MGQTTAQRNGSNLHPSLGQCAWDRTSGELPEHQRKDEDIRCKQDTVQGSGVAMKPGLHSAPHC